ncbi:MAG TPA: DUF3048 domain-containing protein [Candidatus Saccharimonadales bacterium]|nr:DUF3048 domain-containing protein [Candidatus Saccharimonadales bacterium]
MDSDFQPRKPKNRPAKPLQPADSESFRTPEEVAAEPTAEIAETEIPASPAPETQTNTFESNPSMSKKQSKWRRFNRLHWPPGKKEWIILAVLLLLIGGGVGGWLLTHKSKPATIQPIPKVTDASKTVPSTLTGLPVDPSVNQRTVTAVMVENSPQARPQSGLGDAGVVFEAIAEGGVTRFMALYQDTAPNNVGPIRSARPYYVQWSMGFDAGYAHVGGSPDALADIKAWHVRDLDQFSNGGSYHRISSRAAPHNVYTSISALNQLEVQKGYDTSVYKGFVRKKKAVPDKSKPAAAKSINLTLSGPTYNVHYDYNAASNNYGRSVGGAPHVDANTNKQITPAVVIAMVVPYSLGALDSSGAYYSNYGVVGSGPVYVFQDGGVITGTWAKKSNTDQITFTGADGQPIKLNPGQTWITAVSDTGKVSYSP